jgi:hypothetical protein
VTLIQWWLDAPERVSPKVPTIVKAILLPWMLIGILIALVPELQIMPSAVRFILGLSAGLGMLWMALGVCLTIADKLIAFALFVRRKAH